MNETNSAVVTLARVMKVEVTDDTLSIDLEDGRSVSVPIGWYPRLANGTPEERANLQISGAGYGVHWPDLDPNLVRHRRRRTVARQAFVGEHHLSAGCNVAERSSPKTRRSRPIPTGLRLEAQGCRTRLPWDRVRAGSNPEGVAALDSNNERQNVTACGTTT